MTERTVQDIVDDLERITHNSPQIEKALDSLYAQHYLEKKVYRELFNSRLFGTTKYLLARYPDGCIKITDLDTNITYVMQ